MKTKTFLFFVVLFVFSSHIPAQTVPPDNSAAQIQSPNSIDNISIELVKVAKSLQIFNKNFKEFIEHSSQGAKYSEKQQNLLVAFEILNRAEERLAILQKFQIELTEKQGLTRTRLAQIEQDASNEGIDRFVALLGTTRTEEIRENRRRTLEAERQSLRQLAAQISQNLSDTNNELRQAASFVKRLRDKILPQIEQQMAEL